MAAACPIAACGWAAIARVSPTVRSRLVVVGVCATMLATCLSGVALAASPTVRLRAGFRPERLGHSTAVTLAIRIAPPPGAAVPPPLVAADLRYPAGLNVQLSGLGIDACSAATLELLGLEDCPPNSLMGRGFAVAEIPIKHRALLEGAKVAIVRTGEQYGHFAALIYVYGETGVSAQIILPALLLPAATPFGGRLAIQVPLVPSLPETEDVSVGEIHLVIGPPDTLYYERVGRRLVAYRPSGIDLPGRCPHGGFRFAVQLRFLGGESASDATAVPCPQR
jgi:hypothetical protein